MKKPDTALAATVVVKALEKEAKPQIKKVSDLRITTQADFDSAGTLLKQLKTLMKQADEKEKSLTDPLKKVIRDIQELFKPFKTSVINIETDTKEKMLAFVHKQTDKQAKLEEALEQGKMKVNDFVRKRNDLEVQNGPAQVRRLWVAVPINPELTPREYLMPDEQKIKEALRSGKKVKGWEWRQEESIAV